MEQEAQVSTTATQGTDTAVGTLPMASPISGAAPVTTPKEVAPVTPATTQPSPGVAQDNITLTSEQFKERLQRSNAKFLRDKFGTDNIDELAQQFEEAKKLKEADDRRRREALTTQQRLEEDLAKERSARAAAEQRIQALKQQEDVNRERRRVQYLAGKYVDPASVEYAMIKWAKEAQNLPRKQLARTTDGDLEKWFKDFARSNPKHAKPQVARPQPVQAKTGPTNGPGPAQRPNTAKTVSPQVKTARPGQPNTMTKAEIAKEFGVRW